MDPTRIFALLQEACIALEDAQEHAIAAYVGLSMSLIQDKYGVGHDHLAMSTAD